MRHSRECERRAPQKWRVTARRFRRRAGGVVRHHVDGSGPLTITPSTRPRRSEVFGLSRPRPGAARAEAGGEDGGALVGGEASGLAAASARCVGCVRSPNPFERGPGARFGRHGSAGIAGGALDGGDHHRKRSWARGRPP